MLAQAVGYYCCRGLLIYCPGKGAFFSRQLQTQPRIGERYPAYFTAGFWPSQLFVMGLFFMAVHMSGEKRKTKKVNPFRAAAVSFWGRIAKNLTGLSPKRNCSPNRVKTGATDHVRMRKRWRFPAKIIQTDRGARFLNTERYCYPLCRWNVIYLCMCFHHFSIIIFR